MCAPTASREETQEEQPWRETLGKAEMDLVLSYAGESDSISGNRYLSQANVYPVSAGPKEACMSERRIGDTAKLAIEVLLLLLAGIVGYGLSNATIGKLSGKVSDATERVGRLNANMENLEGTLSTLGSDCNGLMDRVNNTEKLLGAIENGDISKAKTLLELVRSYGEDADLAVRIHVIREAVKNRRLIEVGHDCTFSWQGEEEKYGGKYDEVIEPGGRLANLYRRPQQFTQNFDKEPLVMVSINGTWRCQNSRFEIRPYKVTKEGFSVELCVREISKEGPKIPPDVVHVSWIAIGK
jgi:hypothetical protein